MEAVVIHTNIIRGVETVKQLFGSDTQQPTTTQLLINQIFNTMKFRNNSKSIEQAIKLNEALNGLGYKTEHQTLSQNIEVLNEVKNLLFKLESKQLIK